MSIFAIVLQEENKEVKRRAEDAYPRSHFPLSPTVTIIFAKDVPEGIASHVGLIGDKQIQGATGAVFKLEGSYAGHAISTLWDWLREHEGDF